MAALMAHKRIWLPLLAAAACLFATGYTSPVLTMVFVILAFGFVFDAVTLLWSRSGGLSDHRQ